MFDGLKGLFGTKRPVAATLEGGARTRAGKSVPRSRLKRTNLTKRYRILSQTSAQGSMSQVFKAIDEETGRTVCLKLQDAGKTAAALARTSAAEPRPSEGEVLQRISHPNVVRLFDFGESTTGEYYLAMEYVEGVTLAYLREARNPTLGEKLELLAQAADGLAAVHDAGFIHHDFGPRNLLVNSAGQVKLIDFGLAVPNTAEFRRPGNRTGTLQYLAPEVIRREPKDERLDIFAWGVTAFELLTGRAPYDTTGDTMSQMRVRINSDPHDLARVAPQHPTELCTIVRKALARRREDRWPHAATLAEAIREVPTD